MDIQLSDGTVSVGLEDAHRFSAPAQLLVRLDGEDFGPFPTAEAIFYATRTSHSSNPRLSMQRFASIHVSCSFKTDVESFLAASARS